MSERDVLVIGAGVIGLTTGICLAEAGARVRIRSAVRPDETTSVVASAHAGLNFGPADDPMRRWDAVTVRELTAEPGIPGVRVCRGLLVARPPGMTPPSARDIPGFEPAALGDLPPGFATGFWVTAPVVDMPPYIEYLSRRFQAAGGEIEVRPVASLAEAAAESALIANCSGLAARELVPDPLVRPIRGVKVLVENPGLDTFLLEAPLGPAWTAYLPHRDHVVLGGVAVEGDENLTPVAAEAEQILRRCAEVEPRLRGARIIDHRVGLRPGRESVRLAAEAVGRSRCVHNYGHGGSGVQASWGCAREAVAMLIGPV